MVMKGLGVSFARVCMRALFVSASEGWMKAMLSFRRLPGFAVPIRVYCIFWIFSDRVVHSSSAPFHQCVKTPGAPIMTNLDHRSPYTNLEHQSRAVVGPRELCF